MSFPGMYFYLVNVLGVWTLGQCSRGLANNSRLGVGNLRLIPQTEKTKA